jgi:hypothetical protein
MRFRFFLLLGFIAVATVTGLRADEPNPPPTAERHVTELEATMTKMSKSWRHVRKAARDGTLSPELAPLVAGMQANAEAAAKLCPALAEAKSPKDRKKFEADFQDQIRRLIVTLGALESALKANDVATASKLVADVGDLMKAGHKDFKKPDEPGRS